MFLKIVYKSSPNAAAGGYVGHRILAHILSSPSITDSAGLRAAISTNSEILNLINLPACELYRTNDTSNIKAHIAKTSTAYSANLTIEMGAYTNNAVKHYLRFQNTSASNFTSGKTLTGGTMASAQYGFTATGWSNTTATGTGLSMTDEIGFLGIASTADTFNSFFAYVNNNCVMVWMSLGTATASGFPTAYNVSTWSGPHMMAQYKPYDYWNTLDNGMFPAVTTYGVSRNLFNDVAIFNNVCNPISTTLNQTPFRMAHAITNSGPSTSTGPWAVTSGVRATIGIGPRNSCARALFSSVLSTSASSTSTGAFASTTTQHRVPHPNLLNKGYALYPITFKNSMFNIMGGDISAVSDIYLFNGDYTPGDEITDGNRTFIIMPFGFDPTTYRLGIAVPKE